VPSIKKGGPGEAPSFSIGNFDASVESRKNAVFLKKKAQNTFAILEPEFSGANGPNE
jgi:hypothetical protein